MMAFYFYLRETPAIEKEEDPFRMPPAVPGQYETD
jgi:hypothetical protein